MPMLRTYEARHTWCRHDRLNLPIRAAFECAAVKLRTKSIVWSYFKISEDERIQYVKFCKQILIDITIEYLFRRPWHVCVAHRRE